LGWRCTGRGNRPGASSVAPHVNLRCLQLSGCCKFHQTASLDGLQTFSERTMTVTADTGPDAPRESLRERKKLATRRAVRRLAFGLVSERGFSHVTVEDIAEAADVSPRTFFNYFPTKEAALFGADHERMAALREGIAQGLPGETPLDALRVALVKDAEALADE